MFGGHILNHADRRGALTVSCARSRFNRGQVGPYRQSERGEIYKEMADKLVEAGWAYPCFCTEEELIAKREQVSDTFCPSEIIGGI